MDGTAIQKQGPVIAIDGPAGTGKSTIARVLADHLGWLQIDTGALYRAIAFLSLETQQPILEQAIRIAQSVPLNWVHQPHQNPPYRMVAQGRDLTQAIRTPEVSLWSSRIAALPEVREALRVLQRRLGCQGHTILEGRDIGTVIFPDADLKFYLKASLQERAQRRFRELETLGQRHLSLQKVQEHIQQRDESDETRLWAPLKQAPDALVVDTTTMSLKEVIQWMQDQIRSKLKNEISYHNDPPSSL